MANPNCPVCDSNECVTFKKQETIGKGGKNGGDAGLIGGAVIGSGICPGIGTVLGALVGAVAGVTVGGTLDTHIKTWYCSKCDFEFDTKD